MVNTDINCPICGEINRNLDLEETDGWMECSQCRSVVQIAKQTGSQSYLFSGSQCNVLIPLTRR